VRVLPGVEKGFEDAVEATRMLNHELGAKIYDRLFAVDKMAFRKLPGVVLIVTNAYLLV